MNTQLIRNAEEWQAWYTVRRQWDRDYEDDPPKVFPVLVIWLDYEANGYPDVRSIEYTCEELENLVVRMKSGEAGNLPDPPNHFCSSSIDEV